MVYIIKHTVNQEVSHAHTHYICLSQPLRQFAESFRGCFSQRLLKYFVTVLLGLGECQERRSLSGLLRRVAAQVSLSGLSRFLSRWPWSESELAAMWQARFLNPWASQGAGLSGTGFEGKWHHWSRPSMTGSLPAAGQAGRTAEASGTSRGNRSNRLPEHRRFDASEAQRPQDEGTGPASFDDRETAIERA